MIGASDVVYLDHQFEEFPTWNNYTNAESLYFWRDDYRNMRISYTAGNPSYSYVAYEVGLTDAIASGALTMERVLLCMPNSGYSVNGVIYPSTVLSTMRINNGVSGADANYGKIQSVRYRIYGCYVLDVLDWRHYMVPCLRVSDGREGLYDLVDSIFSPILLPNAIKLSQMNRVITSTYPVASDLTIHVGSELLTTTVILPKGSNSVSVNSRYDGIVSITPAYDDVYYYSY